MTRAINTIGLRLAGPVVRCADGRVVTIPWEFVTGSSTRLRTTEAARLIHPGVPERLVGLRGVGTVTIDGLRARALRRAIRQGTHGRVWKVCPIRDLGALIGMILFAAAIGIGAQCGLGRWLLEDDPSDWPSIHAIEANSRLLAGIALGLGTVGPLLVVILGGFSRRSTALALKTSAAGITWYLDDGREVVQPWAAAPVPGVREVIWPKPSKGIRFSGAVVGKHDFGILRAAVRDRLHYQRRRTRAQRAIQMARFVIWSSAAFGAALALILMARVAFPDPIETPYRRPPQLPRDILIAIGAWAAFSLFYGGAAVRLFGWRVIRSSLMGCARR